MTNQRLNGYGAYLLFISLKAHFQSDSYDYWKHHGKTRATKESFNNRNDKLFFEKLSKRYSASELRDFYIANILDGRVFVTDLLDQEANDTYMEYTQRKQSLSYVFTRDLEKIFSKGIENIFKIKEGEYPSILLLYMRGDITLDTLVILNDLVSFEQKFDKCLGKDDIIWSGVSRYMRKYKGFLKYDKKKISKTLKGFLNEQR